MNLADELRKLQELHQSGALTDEEFAQAKATVLARAAASPPAETGITETPPPRDLGVHEQLDEIRRQNQLAQLDREWQIEREQYMMTGRYGGRYVPTAGSSLIGGVVIVGFGILWTCLAASMGGGFDGPFDFFPLFGVLFVLAGAGISIYSFTRANQYQQAYDRYRRRRAHLVSDDETNSPSH